jgi:hypothetical protein
MTIFLCLITLLFTSNTDSHLIDTITIDSIIVYVDFKQKGYSTTGAFNQIVEYEKLKTKTKRLNVEDVTKIENMLIHAKVKKHFQTKLGINNVFFKFFLNKENSQTSFVLSKGIGFYVWIDLLNKKEYYISLVGDIKFTEDILLRLKTNEY